MGSPQAAAVSLHALVAGGHGVELVVTQPDRRRTRRGEPTPNAVKVVAEKSGIAVTHEVDDAAKVGADAAIVVAYGQILSRRLLERLPMINLHFSLLPRWRGAAPVEHAILAGDTRTGVCVSAIEVDVDTGAVYACEATEIHEDETAAELTDRLAAIGADLLVSSLHAGLPEPTAQSGEVTIAPKLTSADRRIDWTETAEMISRVVRIGDAWSTVDGKRLKVHAVATADRQPLAPGELDEVHVGTAHGVIELREVQPSGRPVMSARDWRRGAGDVGLLK